VALLWRVCFYLPGVRDPARPGHPLYVHPQQTGRLDNPDLYRTLYASDSPAGACAEAFGSLPTWRGSMLRGRPDLPGSVRALAGIDVPDDVAPCALDDPRRLLALDLRPSLVLTRDRAVTQAWARRLFRSQRWAGVSWWSYYDSRWTSVGLWARDRIRLAHVETLTGLDDPALREAAEVLCRPLPGP